MYFLCVIFLHLLKHNLLKNLGDSFFDMRRTDNSMKTSFVYVKTVDWPRHVDIAASGEEIMKRRSRQLIKK